MASVFFSYSHKDEALRDQLEAHLALLKNQGLIDAWHDRRIVAGDAVDDRIFDRLETADIILLLVSSDFISSTYCYSKEMSRALELHNLGKARVIPVILRHCMWKESPFGGLMAAPRDGRPVTSWPDKDEALADVAKEVARAIKSIGNQVLISGPNSFKSGQPPTAVDASVKSTKPRSSNLRLRKEFTEADRDEFVRSTFDFICNFFEGSIEAISSRNPEVRGVYERIDTRRMTALIYRGGKKIAECSIRREGFGRDNAIAFSYDSLARTGSFNEMLSAEHDEQSIYLKPLGMPWSSEGKAHLSEDGAAEYLWELFIKSAQ